MTDCPHHGNLCEIIICGRVPYECGEKAEWYVTFGDRERMPRCGEHVAAACGYSAMNAVTRIPKRDHGE